MQLPITPYKIRKAWKYWRHFGTKEFMNHLMDRLEPEDVPYGPWFEERRAKDTELLRQRNHPPKERPLISIVVPAFHTPEKFLRQMIESVTDQSYAEWELVIADAGASDESEETGKKRRSVREVTAEWMARDSRIRYIPLEKNEGIAGNTNRAVGASRGEYIAFLDHDDLLEPDALYEIASAISLRHADMLYTDEDKITEDGGKHFQPNFKPEFNLDLLRSNNYITHFLVVSRKLADQAGPFDETMNGAQDYDFIFRCAEKAARIARVPRVLYHWRTHSASTADNPMSKQYAYEAGRRAIEHHLERTGTDGVVEMLPDFGFYRVRYPVKGEPLVSVLIPNRDQTESLRACIDSLLDTGYPRLEIIVIENNSTERAAFEYYRELAARPEVRLVRWKKGFNYSAINNYGERFAAGDYLLLLNNDVRGTISRDWLTEMLSVCQREDVGAVGARLYYPDNRIQSAGVVVGMGGIAGSMFVGLPRGRSGYLHKSAIMQDLSAVTAACMMVKREAFEKVGGFSTALAVAFNDVDLCLRIGRSGYRIVYDPYAELYHDESLSRGPEDSEEKVRRFQGEIETFRENWEDVLKEGDPMYNPNLSLKKWNYSLRV